MLEFASKERKLVRILLKGNEVEIYHIINETLVVSNL